MNRDPPEEQLQGRCNEVQPPLPELLTECRLSTHTVLNAQPSETEVPKQLLQCQCGTVSRTYSFADENHELHSLSKCVNQAYPNEDEIDCDCSMECEDTDICSDADQNSTNDKCYDGNDRSNNHMLLAMTVDNCDGETDDID